MAVGSGTHSLGAAGLRSGVRAAGQRSGTPSPGSGGIGMSPKVIGSVSAAVHRGFTGTRFAPGEATAWPIMTGRTNGAAG